MAILNIPRGLVLYMLEEPGGRWCMHNCVTVNPPFRFKDTFGEKVHAAKPYSLNNEFCKELASEMVSGIISPLS